jgi:hypothetical protein
LLLMSGARQAFEWQAMRLPHNFPVFRRYEYL